MFLEGHHCFEPEGKKGGYVDRGQDINVGVETSSHGIDKIAGT